MDPDEEVIVEPIACVVEVTDGAVSSRYAIDEDFCPIAGTLPAPVTDRGSLSTPEETSSSSPSLFLLCVEDRGHSSSLNRSIVSFGLDSKTWYGELIMSITKDGFLALALSTAADEEESGLCCGDLFSHPSPLSLLVRFFAFFLDVAECLKLTLTNILLPAA